MVSRNPLALTSMEEQVLYLTTDVYWPTSFLHILSENLFCPPDKFFIGFSKTGLLIKSALQKRLADPNFDLFPSCYVYLFRFSRWVFTQIQYRQDILSPPSHQLS
jgi:hypothetical protein